ncbi:VRR-NUC domain-containing protein [Hahella ganghwensis]|uniref:VRR-NUC domain-containing protein n=1 Tax=Hahella ganghwensis TaxID=286420 RepID=UPI000375638B|nr:VRR-NUC domain-containing protein [Hahella ganghwensis]
MRYQIPSEHEEQKALVQWADCQRIPQGLIGDFLFSVPNGGDRHRIVAAKLKAEGVRKGVPDLMLALPLGGYAGLFIEMKRRKGGKLYSHQQQWITRLKKVGYKVVVCAGWDAARIAIIQYLQTGKERSAA